MAQHTELGEFLRSRRARLTPRDVGLVDYGGQRRVPGLRREELARLAGVSITYYTRLEQGQSPNASTAVLDAIARALRLNEQERAYLHSLATAHRRVRPRAEPERLRPGLDRLIDSFGSIPALIIGRRADVLAWNPMAHALLAGHVPFESASRTPADRPNLARLVFLDQHTRELYVDWERKGADAVAYLRMSAAEFPNDPMLAELVGELTLHSPDFARMWAAHPVRRCAHNTRDYRHPLVGALTLHDEMLQLPDDPGQRLVLFRAEVDSSSAAALALLADGQAEPGKVPSATARDRRR